MKVKSLIKKCNNSLTDIRIDGYSYFLMTKDWKKTELTKEVKSFTIRENTLFITVQR